MLETKEGPITITRPDGKLATFSSPGHPDRPIALKRRELPELLAEELRRLDEDDVYAATARRLAKVAGTSMSAPRVEVHEDAAALAASAAGELLTAAGDRPGGRPGAAHRAHRRQHRRPAAPRAGPALPRARTSTGRGWSSGGATSASSAPARRTATPARPGRRSSTRSAPPRCTRCRPPRPRPTRTRAPRRTPPSCASTAAVSSRSSCSASARTATSRRSSPASRPSTSTTGSRSASPAPPSPRRSGSA